MKKLLLGAALLLVVAIVSFQYGRLHGSAGPLAHKPLYYVDPMHPAYRSSQPGKAPDCGMDLVPVYPEDLAGTSSSGTESGSIKINANIRQQYGIKLAKVARDSGTDTIRVFGRVAADETRVFRLNLGTDGYVKETHSDAVGNFVKKDQTLATIYSPEFLSVIGGYLSANERAPGASGPEYTQNAASAQARADRLRNLGMSDLQIREISESRKIPEDVYIVSPVDGFILSRTISAGLRFERHNELYAVADLSHVWIVAEAFGSDAQAFQPGALVNVTVPGTAEIYTACVTNVLPDADPIAGAIKVRLDVGNPGFKLRPNMAVDVIAHHTRSAGLSVPVDALLDTGRTQRVFVQISEGTLMPRVVRIGDRYSDRVQILEGLKEGDLVVSDGAFLVDSENRLASSSGIDSDGAMALRKAHSSEAVDGGKQ